MTAIITVEEAIKRLTDEVKKDLSVGGYAYGWKSNLAMSFYDEITSATEIDHSKAHEIANNAADRFMQLLFGAQCENQ